MDASASVTVFGFATEGPARKQHRKPQRSRSLLSESLRSGTSSCQLTRASSSHSEGFSDDESEAPSASSSQPSVGGMERAWSAPIPIHDERSAARIERAVVKGQQRELLQHVRSWLRDNTHPQRVAVTPQ